MKPRIECLESRLSLSNYYVATTGNDAAAGTVAAPWKTLQHAVASVASGDVVNLRAGTYAGGIFIDTDGVTIQSYPNERATVTAPSNVNNLYFGAKNGKVLNLNLDGGFYGIKFDQSNGTVDGDKIINSVYDAIKIVPNVDNVVISNTEISQTNGGGIDDVNGDNLIVRDSYIHDIGGDAITAKGGAINALIERNRVENIGGSGILIGQSTDTVFLDTTQNPGLYENIDGIVRNNIVQGTNYSGIGLYAALRPQIYNNTLVNTAKVGQASVYVVYMNHDATLTSTSNPSVVNNIVTRTTASARPMVFITSQGATGTVTFDHNIYHNGTSAASFWDERAPAFYGGFSAWQAHIHGDTNSREVDPLVDSTGHLTANSPAIDTGRTLTAVLDDFDKQIRSGAYDIGVDELSGATPPPPPPITENHAPTANADTAVTTTNKSVAINVLANDTDPDGDKLTIVSTTKSDHGTVVINSEGIIVYTPNSGFKGIDHFVYTISDGHGHTASQQVTVSVVNREKNNRRI